MRSNEELFKDGWGSGALATTTFTTTELLNYWIDQQGLNDIGADGAARRQALRDGRTDFLAALNDVEAECRRILRQNRKSAEFDGDNNYVDVMIDNTDLTALEALIVTLLATIAV